VARLRSTIPYAGFAHAVRASYAGAATCRYLTSAEPLERLGALRATTDATCVRTQRLWRRGLHRLFVLRRERAVSLWRTSVVQGATGGVVISRTPARELIVAVGRGGPLALLERAEKLWNAYHDMTAASAQPDRQASFPFAARKMRFTL
jgi:hypothetical protein